MQVTYISSIQLQYIDIYILYVHNLFIFISVSLCQSIYAYMRIDIYVYLNIFVYMLSMCRGVLQVGNIAATTEIEPISLAFWASVLAISHCIS